MGGFNEYGAIKKLGLRHVRDAFCGADKISVEWRALNYAGAPDYQRAIAEYDRFASFFTDQGVEIVWLPQEPSLTMDAVYVRDATLISPKGLIACSMGKAARSHEPALASQLYSKSGFPVAGAIQGQGKIEGGDFIWLDDACAVGWGYRTNAEGIRQLKDTLGPQTHVEVVGLPHYKGPSDVFHLMSFISPLDHDLALIYSPVMPVPFRNWLLDRGIRFVEVPDEEFETMACNVLALAPRKCLMVAGNPETRRRLEAAGCEVLIYEGWEISRKGEGGPTCLTRPLERE